MSIAKETELSSEESGGSQLSMHERAHLELIRTYSIKITLKNSRNISMRIDAPRKIDAFMEMAVEAEKEGWDESIVHISIEDMEGRFS